MAIETHSVTADQCPGIRHPRTGRPLRRCIPSHARPRDQKAQRGRLRAQASQLMLGTAVRSGRTAAEVWAMQRRYATPSISRVPSAVCDQYRWQRPHDRRERTVTLVLGRQIIRLDELDSVLAHEMGHVLGST